ncbi:polynucleotide 5'-hydroxyl-kinase NOL9 isoform X2 [Erinaceus europaeus]|uniref:Polynucleotide 5'-hydroxyl-kinase NOL9 isoform X2 n=1 Tax=Erinaceus europaeus TaxID=9365 RepID=A0ABM3Y8F9_ERIEU|nr:polynucleotide 5'-hydroxyl-kinase NOL9 isoform X2 [Erinaceus europaeus]
MADSLLQRKRGSSRATWLRARKGRPQLILSRRHRRRLRTLRWRGRKRLKRRLQLAHAAGADWREGVCPVSRTSVAWKPKTADPRPAPALAPAPDPDEGCAWRRPAWLPIPPVRPAGRGRALLLLPLEQTPTFQINAESLALRSVGIRRGKKKIGHRLTESFLSAVEELVSVSCEEADGCPIILVCGSQDVGKSTFNRYLINQLLNCLPCVDYLECDLGQTEFTPPGCISLFNITEPILGPPFTHQRTPQKMVYYGKPSCNSSCENYIEIIKYVFSAYKRESPLIVNTMGWVTDEGLLLLIDLIRLLSPSHVIQFGSSRSPYMPDLTSAYVDDMDGLYTKSKAKVRNRGYNLPEFADILEFADEEKESPVFFTGHKLMCIKAEFIIRKTSRNRETYNKILRGLAVLGYLGKLQPPVPKPLCPLHGLTPYQVPFNAVALRVIHSDVAPTHILYAVNASWVGLCKILDDVGGYTRGPILLAQTPICDCVGFGICRGIDMENRLYHILTPVPPEELRNVNCLLVGAISIPQCVFQCQQGLEGTMPYVTTDYNFKLPGASDKIGAREGNKKPQEKLHPKRKFYRKTK